MKFKDNFSQILLVSEGDVIFYSDDRYLKQNVDFAMKIVTIKDILTHPYIQTAIFLFGLTPSDIKKHFNINDKMELWDFIHLIGIDHYTFIIRAIRFYFSFVFGEQFIANKNGWFLGEIRIDQQLFDRIKEITLIAAGAKNFNEQSTLQPQWLIDKEAEIRRIKNQNNKQQVSNANQVFENLMKVFLPLNYELHYTFEQLFNMNYFHVQYLSKYVPKIVGYDIQKRQIMSKKKLKYITEK